jgi:hypothetical protein
MANNIKQIKAAIEANLAKIRDAYYAALNSNSSAEGIETARANYATDLQQAQLNAIKLLDNQTPFSDSQYGTLQVVLNTGIPSTGIISVVGAAEASGGGISMQPEAEPSISETNPDILRAECIALFNRYLELYRQLETMKTLHNLFTVRDFWRDLTGEDSNGVMKCAVACIYNQFSPEGSRRKPLESCSDYVKRVGEESWVKKLHEILEKTRTKPLPDSSTPIFDPDNPNTWPVFDLEEVLKALRKAFKDGGLVLGDLQLSSDCYEKFSRAIEMFAEVLIIFNNAMRLIVQLMQIAIKLRRSPCWDLLNLEQEFRDRNLFDFSWGYFEYFSEWIRNWWNPFAPTPRLNPVLANIPSSTTIDEFRQYHRNTVNYLNTFFYGNRPDRVDVWQNKYLAWKNNPSERSSQFPPIKDLCMVADGTNITDENVAWYVLLKFYANRNAFANLNVFWDSAFEQSFAITDAFMPTAETNNYLPMTSFAPKSKINIVTREIEVVVDIPVVEYSNEDCAFARGEFISLQAELNMLQEKLRSLAEKLERINVDALQDAFYCYFACIYEQLGAGTRDMELETCREFVERIDAGGSMGSWGLSQYPTGESLPDEVIQNCHFWLNQIQEFLSFVIELLEIFEQIMTRTVRLMHLFAIVMTCESQSPSRQSKLMTLSDSIFAMGDEMRRILKGLELGHAVPSTSSLYDPSITGGEWLPKWIEKRADKSNNSTNKTDRKYAFTMLTWYINNRNNISTYLLPTV